MSDHSESLSSRIEGRISMQLEVASRMKNKAADIPYAPFITLSRQYGCEAMALAEQLGRDLEVREHIAGDQWQIYSRKIIEDVSQEVKLSSRILEALYQPSRSGLEEFFQTLVGQSPPDIEVLRHLVNTIRALALHGRCIIVGRGGAVLTRGLPGGIHVRLVAPENWRMKNLIKRFQWEESRARMLLRDEEDNRNSFFQKYLQQDISSTDHYDLVLNVERMNRNEQVAAICAIFEHRFLLNAKR